MYEVSLILKIWTIPRFKDIVIDNVIEIFVNGDYICFLIGLSEDITEYESIDDFEIIIIHYFKIDNDSLWIFGILYLTY